MTREEALKNLAEKLTAAGHRVGLHNGVYIRSVDGALIAIEACEEYKGGSYGTQKSGKVRLIIGGYGNKVQFPQRKDGEYNWDAIIKAIADRVKQKLYASERNAVAEAKLAQAEVECDQLREAYGLQRYEGLIRVVPSNYGIELKVSSEITKEQAEILIKAAKEAGLI